jgi:hypothetical protein
LGDGTFGRQARDEKYIQNYSWKTSKGTDRLGNHGAVEKIILKWNL